MSIIKSTFLYGPHDSHEVPDTRRLSYETSHALRNAGVTEVWEEGLQLLNFAMDGS